MRNYLTNQQYDNYTFNLTNNITIPSANGEIEVRYRAIINMNGKTIMAENPTIRIFHVVSQGSLPYMPSLTLTGNGTLNGGGSVSSNEAGNAGGIHLVDQCTFNLTGGSISGNRAIQSGNANKNCGGVNITGNSTMNMSGGSIADNTAS